MPLTPLHAFRQFILVLLVPRADGRTDKLPCRADGTVCNAHDPSAWMSYAEAAALATSSGGAYGVGFVLTDADPFFCIDIDGAATPTGWSPVAQQLCSALPGTVVEVSQSGRGLHIWGRRTAPPPHASKNTALHLECYTRARFILLGTGAVGTMAEDCPAFDAVVAGYFPPRNAGGDIPDSGPRTDWRGPADDAELIRRALRSQSAGAVFGGKASFAALWDADEAALARAYPATGDGPYDRSSADAALAQHLAFWTGCDGARIERLMRGSKLARDKWDREDYLPRTITNACGMQRDVLVDKPVASPAPAPAAAGVDVAPAPSGRIALQEARTFLSPSEQTEFFAGCVYVLEANRILVPGGRLLNQERFRAQYGGRTFAMDKLNERTSRNAWEAFTESQALVTPRADGVCFRPVLPYGTIVQEAGRTLVNTWWPVHTPRVKGDVAPFLRHLRLLFPAEVDRNIATYYLAALVQNPGVKFTWALVIQGVEGNGKSFLSRVIAFCLGARYVHWPKASKIAGQFNAWMVGKLAYLVEDIYTDPDSNILEELKPLIAGGAEIEIEQKGVDQTSTDICGNFILNTNIKNGLRKTANDRRLCPLFCAQQHRDDLARDGMDGAYMAALYDWAKAGGYAAIHDYLATLPIPDALNPATQCQRAPMTSSTQEAIEAGRGRIEQEIMEAVEQGLPGFAGGWISSVMLDKHLVNLRLDGRVGRNRRREILRELGYVPHPALKDGRTDNLVMPDGAKPRLYVATGHSALRLEARPEVVAAYTTAQSPAK